VRFVDAVQDISDLKVGVVDHCVQLGEQLKLRCGTRLALLPSAQALLAGAVAHSQPVEHERSHQRRDRYDRADRRPVQSPGPLALWRTQL
jgi:hypothetical protein